MSETTLPDGATLGAALRAAREAAGKSIEDVSATTRIRTTLIRDLEADHFESSGAPVYARGHIRAIAHACGVDAEPYVELFGRQVAAVQPPAAPAVDIPAARAPLPPSDPLHVPKAARPERRGPNWIAAASAALALLVVLFAIGQLTKPSGSGSPSAATSPTPAPTARSKPAVAPTKAPPLTAQRPATTGADLRVRLIGGDSWISVRNASRTLFEGVLRNGAIQDFKDAKQLRLIVGNAGAVNIVCSGRDLAPAGGQGSVVRFTCNADGLVPA